MSARVTGMLVSFRVTSRTFVFVFGVVAIGVSTEAPAQSSGAVPPAVDATIAFTPGDGPRSYRLHVPAGYAGEIVPLVLNFHSAGGTPEGQAATSGFDTIADREGFIVVYPEGIFDNGLATRTWNANAGEGVDDVQFARDVIEDIAAKFPIDRGRIYATGFAAGALIASRLACALSDVLAAAAPVAGLQYPDDCLPSSPVSIVAFHGRADEVAAQKWRSALGCPEGAMDGGFRNAPGVVLRVWPPCAGGADLMIYISETDGHAWPEGASERIWAFFEAHPR